MVKSVVLYSVGIYVKEQKNHSVQSRRGRHTLKHTVRIQIKLALASLIILGARHQSTNNSYCYPSKQFEYQTVDDTEEKFQAYTAFHPWSPFIYLFCWWNNDQRHVLIRQGSRSAPTQPNYYVQQGGVQGPKSRTNILLTLFPTGPLKSVIYMYC